MKASDPKQFGSQLAQLRKSQGLSQEGLAKASGVPITAIRRCEQKGSIPLDRFLTLTAVLNARLQVVPEATVAGAVRSRPGRLPYKSIEEVIAASDRHAQTSPDAATATAAKASRRKPQLGGRFGQTRQSPSA